MIKKKQKSKILNQNQQSFYFQDFYISSESHKSKLNIIEDRIFILFSVFVFLISIFAIKVFLISIERPKKLSYHQTYSEFAPIRRDIVDRNGNLISSSIQMYNAAIRSNLVKDKKKLILKLQLQFPEINTETLSNNLDNKKYFYFKKRLTNKEYKKLWLMGEKGIVFEPVQNRIYPHSNLFSHLIGQTDDDNYGISGIEYFFDKELIKAELNDTPLTLTVDLNIQHVINKELKKSINTFNANGAGALLMDADNGEVISLVSLPDFDLNKREKINSDEFTNKITKGIFELGSIFKTFTVALALDENIVTPSTIIKNIPNTVKCSKHEISDMKKFPNEMSVEEILIKSSNVGTLKIARMIGQNKFESFIEKLNLNSRANLELGELGMPHSLKWNKCKLETISYGHGITTTPLQAATAYAAMVNGGYYVKPTLKKDTHLKKKTRVIKESTSKSINSILRKVVTHKDGTARLANIFGYEVSGKTGTSQYYSNKNKNINTFISYFVSNEKKYILLIMLDDPKIARDLIYDYNGFKIKGFRNEAGWNVVYVAGKIIERIGPILAINKNNSKKINVVKKFN